VITASRQDRIAAMERRLDEMQRRTMSTLSITNPVDGITYVQINDGQVWIYDSNGTLILAGASSWGYLNPWQNYVAFPATPPLISNALTGAMQNTATATLYPNQARMFFTVTASADSVTGGIADVQVTYTVNGGSPVLIADSVNETGTTVTYSFEYVWPADYFGDRINILFQARVRPGTGDPLNDMAIFGPIRLYGGPQ
jgi:hypothetical protein